MRCETCQGIGKVTYDQHPEPKPQPFGSVFPCPECAGSGITHCCDGLTACNDIPEGYEMFEGKLTKVVDASRSGWWRYHQHYDRDGYCDNPARGY